MTAGRRLCLVGIVFTTCIVLTIHSVHRLHYGSQNERSTGNHILVNAKVPLAKEDVHTNNEHDEHDNGLLHNENGE